jgi:putative OPT family oligopeptide transporter
MTGRSSGREGAPMQPNSAGDPAGLPENAYRELKPGEVYRPVIPPESRVAEVTTRSIVFGLAMTILFSAAAAYVALKLGQGIESAIPISILAIGFSAMVARKSTLLENVNIISLGATAGIVVGGSVFTMPAIYILGLENYSSFWQIFVVPLFGAMLGVLFLIPFRRYFVAEMHGKLPFPEATATTEILVTGERGGKQAVVLLYSMGLGFVMDFLALTFKVWSDLFTTSLIPRLRSVTDDVKAVFNLNTSAAVLGLGYIIGLKYASIICAGSFLSYFVLIPLFAKLGALIPGGVIFPGTPSIEGMDYAMIFSKYVRYIGIGGIFTAGFLSIIKMSPVMKQAIGKVFAEVAKLGSASKDAAAIRTEQDIPMSRVILMGAILAVVIWAYFRFAVLAGMEGATMISILSLILTFVIAFLFAAVSAWAVALISVTPVSGMTLTTLIISAVLLSQMGLHGPQGQLAVLLIGGVVCTSLSMTGSMVTMLKVGYWLGATPRKIQIALLAGSVLASLTVTGVIVLFAHSYGYVASPEHATPVSAPQANAMAAVIQSVMTSGQAPWFLYGLGAVIAVVVQMLGISPLAFALGMYLPIELNTPILAGAFVGYLVQRPTGNGALDRARGNRGTLIASGFIAGGAIAGVVDALLQYLGPKYAPSMLPSIVGLFEYAASAKNWVGLLVFVALCVYLFIDARRAKAEEAGPADRENVRQDLRLVVVFDGVHGLPDEPRDKHGHDHRQRGEHQRGDDSAAIWAQETE